MKSFFTRSQLEHLGCWIAHTGTKPVCDKAKAVLKIVEPASARRATGNHPEATGMPMMKGQLGANCPFRTAIALSERPKPRRTPTKAH